MASFNKLVVDICDYGDKLQAASLALTALAAEMPFIEFRNKVARIIGNKYDVKPYKGQGKPWLTFEKDSAAEQKLSAICKLHPQRPDAGQTRGKADVPPRLISSIKREIINAGLTKEQMNALFRALRDEITFK